jgi:hypothetical protein
MILCLMVVLFHINSAVVMADDIAVEDQTSNSSPQTADQIVKRIRAIVDHGDLADEEYYAEKLGAIIQGGKINSVVEPDFACGLGIASNRERLVEQRFYYKDVPWYFASWFGRNRVCDHPYEKIFLQNGRIEVVGKLVIDAKKICITKDDLKKYFKSGEFRDDRGGFGLNYSISKENDISLEVISPSSSPKCAVYINFYQNRI